MGGNPFAEWQRSPPLRQRDIDRMTRAGVPVLSLVTCRAGLGFCVKTDRVVVSPDGRRFEFSRYSRSSFLDVPAYVVLALDREGELVDLVAFHDGFVASWLGRVSLLGEENLDCARLDDRLVVHADPTAWLRAGRDGVVVVDPIRAAPLLRDASTMQVNSYAERRRLNDMMTVKLPRIIVSSALSAIAAE